MRAEAPLAAPAVATWQATQVLARWPFDALRAQRARAVQAGWLPNSMLAGRDFERVLGVLEKLTLGPLARRV